MDHERLILVLALCLQLISSGHALVGYDCGNAITNITTISLVDIGECDIKPPPVNASSIKGQLLQLNDFDMTRTYKCSVKISRTITHCGMHHHASRVLHGELSYYKDLTREECMLMHATKFITIYNKPYGDLRLNATTVIPLVFAGRVDHEGHCKGSTYDDVYGHYEDAVVAGTAEIILKDYYAEVSLDSDAIKLQGGVTCKFTQHQCTDYDGGYLFWDALPVDSCGARKYSVLYEGRMDKVQEVGTNKILYSLKSQGVTFALWKAGEFRVCNAKVSRTEHPKLFILEDVESKFVKEGVIVTANLDMFAFVNSKFLYVEKHIRKQLNDLYYDILRHKCELERKIMDQALSLATIAPDEVAYKIMGDPGYLAVTSGEVIHLIKCIQAEVTRRTIEGEGRCYEQLPVKRGEENLFLAPRTRILTRTGKQISCDDRLPIMYKLADHWFKLLPNPVEVKAPEVLKPDSRPTWHYVSPAALAIAGIYSPQNLDRLRDRILFPVERPSIVHKVAFGVTGHAVETSDVTLYNLFNPETISQLAENAWDKMWTHFLAFGTASAGLIGLIMLARLIKLLVDTIIHGYALYSLYGFSIHLLGAVWNSITQLLLHLGQQQREKREREQAVANSIENSENEKDERKEEDLGKRLYPDLPLEDRHNSL